MRLFGWLFLIIGLLGFAATALVAIVDVGVRDQYFSDGGALPWYMAVNGWSASASLLLCILGALLVRRGRQHNALS